MASACETPQEVKRVLRSKKNMIATYSRPDGVYDLLAYGADGAKGEGEADSFSSHTAPWALLFHPAHVTTAPNTPKYSNAVNRLGKPVAGRQHEEVDRKRQCRSFEPRNQDLRLLLIHTICDCPLTVDLGSVRPIKP